MEYKGWKQFIGLMFKTKKEEAIFILDRERKQSIHSFFMLYSFIARFYDSDGDLVDEKIIKPFKIYRPRVAWKKLIEIPI